MKSKLLSALVLAFALILVAVPTFAASSTYDYVISYTVNGKKTGEYHTLSSGSAKISGYSYYNGSSDPGAVISAKGEDVTYQLYKDDSFFDSYYGSVKQNVSASSSPTNVDNFSGTFPNKLGSSSSKYYLVITKANNGWHMKGHGTLSN